MIAPSRNHPRASNDTSARGLSRGNSIIVAVCASVGGLLLALFLIRIIRKLHRSSNSNPLPPVQPLAHHREQLAQADSRTRTLGPTRLSIYHPSYTPTPSGSKASLIGEQHSRRNNPSSPSSPTSNTYEWPGLAVNSERLLSIPTLHDPLESSSSLGSTNVEELSALTPNLQLANLSATPPPFRRVRPLSMSSSHNTFVSRTSRHSIQGMPHSRHSQVQIVLPTPLALIPNNTLDGFDRRSVVDRWVLLGDGRAYFVGLHCVSILTFFLLQCSGARSGSAYLLITYVNINDVIFLSHLI